MSCVLHGPRPGPLLLFGRRVFFTRPNGRRVHEKVARTGQGQLTEAGRDAFGKTRRSVDGGGLYSDNRGDGENRVAELNHYVVVFFCVD